MTRMDILKAGWTPYVYYTTLYSSYRQPSMRVNWADFLKKWGNQSKRKLCKERVEG